MTNNNAAAAPFIRIERLRKSYGASENGILAVSDVTFDVQNGEFVSLLGPSGCGKSTLLKIVAGLLHQDEGTLAVGNADNPFNASRDIGMVFQQPLLLKWRTVIENVLLPAEILGLPMSECRERAGDLLELVGLAAFHNRRPYELSGGMQQRAAIARSLVHDPKLVLMDEPFGALDALTRERMNVELRRIWQQSGKTILFVTHSISEAVFLGTRVIVLTSRPARMAANIRVELRTERDLAMKTHETFGEYTRKIYQLLDMS
jgi:NitT/TauT family transport system ATP-binding protein